MKYRIKIEHLNSGQKNYTPQVKNKYGYATEELVTKDMEKYINWNEPKKESTIVNVIRSW